MKKIWMLKMVVLFIFFLALKSVLLMLLWNWLVPQLFHGPVINFIQSTGLIILSKILFSGFGRLFHGKQGWRGRCEHWKSRFDKLSPEERERMRSIWKQRCSGMSSRAASDSSGRAREE